MTQSRVSNEFLDRQHHAATILKVPQQMSPTTGSLRSLCKLACHSHRLQQSRTTKSWTPRRPAVHSTATRHHDVVIDVVLFSHIKQLTPARQNISMDTEGGLVKEQTLDLRQAGCEDRRASLRNVKHQTTVRSNSVQKSSSLKTSFKVGLGTSSTVEYQRKFPRPIRDRQPTRKSWEHLTKQRIRFHIEIRSLADVRRGALGKEL